MTSWITTTDHKRIGVMYICTSLGFFGAAVVMAMLMRTQLIRPENGLLSPGQYNQIFTMHGTTMVFLFAMPMLAGLANYLVPLMIGARDMAFPRLNAFSYWVYLFAGLLLYSSFIFGGAPDTGWFSYAPAHGAPVLRPQRGGLLDRLPRDTGRVVDGRRHQHHSLPSSACGLPACVCG